MPHERQRPGVPREPRASRILITYLRYWRVWRTRDMEVSTWSVAMIIYRIEQAQRAGGLVNDPDINQVTMSYFTSDYTLTVAFSLRRWRGMRVIKKTSFRQCAGTYVFAETDNKNKR